MLGGEQLLAWSVHPDVASQNKCPEFNVLWYAFEFTSLISEEYSTLEPNQKYLMFSLYLI